MGVFVGQPTHPTRRRGFESEVSLSFCYFGFLGTQDILGALQLFDGIVGLRIGIGMLPLLVFSITQPQFCDWTVVTSIGYTSVVLSLSLSFASD